ncbi:uncharacterized protein Dmul_04650 [Desulfococcus multivorans]|nr:uncharacterized protein Dmul_04650 [Desulfococcus multivorans]
MTRHVTISPFIYSDAGVTIPINATGLFYPIQLLSFRYPAHKRQERDKGKDKNCMPHIPLLIEMVKTLGKKKAELPFFKATRLSH